jgi:hypothetical protein
MLYLLRVVGRSRVQAKPASVRTPVRSFQIVNGARSRKRSGETQRLTKTGI